MDHKVIHDLIPYMGAINPLSINWKVNDSVAENGYATKNLKFLSTFWDLTNVEIEGVCAFDVAEAPMNDEKFGETEKYSFVSNSPVDAWNCDSPVVKFPVKFEYA